MRILLITSTVSEKSGWGRHSRAIADALQKKSVEVEVFADNKKLTLLRLLKNCLVARSSAKSADVVHSIDGWPYGVYGFAAVLGTRKKLFINGIGTYSVAPLYHFGKAWLLKKAYACAKHIFAISRYTRQMMIAGGVDAGKITVVHYGVPQFSPTAGSENSSLAETFGIPHEASPIVLTVGAIKDRKGQLDTLKAVAILKEKYPHILYVMAGSGNAEAYTGEIELYIKERDLQNNARILSGVNDESLAFLYERATLFALNSTTDKTNHHFEGFGAAILEANIFGKPAVGSRDSGIEDAIEDGKSGLLANQRDPHDIAEKIEKIIAGYASFSAHARLFAAGFSWEKTVQTYIDLYANA